MNLKFKFMMPLVIVLSIIITAVLVTSYNTAKNEMLNIGGEMFARVNKDVMGFIQAMDKQVLAGKLTLEEAQEIVRTYVNGPKNSDGSRSMSQSKMSAGDDMYIWAIGTKGNNKGTTFMAPYNEGKNFWDSQTDGKYTYRDSWANADKTGAVFREIWQNPGEPAYTCIAYQGYYEPWDWLVGIGGNEKVIYAERMNSLQIQLAVIILIYISLIAIFIYYVVNTNNTLKKSIGILTKSSEQIIAGSQQVSSASQSLAQASSEQASSMEETTSSLEEMSSMTQRNADNARQADNLMKDVRKVVEKANQSMNQLTVSMEEICRASEETSKIIKTIDEIAFQTNLLSLNAAVEAARAGEAGAGFAVVADEVKNLAMRSADAAKSTSTLIESTVKKIQSGSGLVTQTNSAFSEVTGISVKIGDLVGEIAAASDEQARGIQQINNSAIEMDKITQSNAANAEETSSASEQMYTQAKQMKSFVVSLSSMFSSNEDMEMSFIKTRSSSIHKSEPSIKGKTSHAARPPLKFAKKEPVRKTKGSKEEIRPEDLIPFDDDFSDF